MQLEASYDFFSFVLFFEKKSHIVIPELLKLAI